REFARTKRSTRGGRLAFELLDPNSGRASTSSVGDVAPVPAVLTRRNHVPPPRFHTARAVPRRASRARLPRRFRGELLQQELHPRRPDRSAAEPPPAVAPPPQPPPAAAPARPPRDGLTGWDHRISRAVPAAGTAPAFHPGVPRPAPRRTP